jgi:hypothetical protein
MRLLPLALGCLFFSSCFSFKRPTFRNPPPEPPRVLENITEEDFKKLDCNEDGVLDLGEIKKAPPPDTLSAPIEIFSFLVLAIAIICIIPALPTLTSKISTFCKKHLDRDKKSP